MIQIAITCGLYRTTAALPSNTEAIGPNQLVYFHNHSDQGVAMIQVPEINRHNVWTFQKKGLAVRDEAFPSTLVALKKEGLWRLREHFHPEPDSIAAANTVVQLGYNRDAEPIVFFPQQVDQVNGISFPSRGTKIPPSIYDLLEPLVVGGPAKTRKLH